MRLGDWRERQRGDAAVGRLDHVVLDSCRHDLELYCELTSEEIRCHKYYCIGRDDYQLWEGISAAGD
jgi:hypothetical protein